MASRTAETSAREIVFDRLPEAVRRASLAFVLVVPADPELPLFALVAALRCVIEDRVVAHEKLQSTPRRRVRVVDGVVVAYERAEPGALGEVTSDVGARRACVVLDDRR